MAIDKPLVAQGSVAFRLDHGSGIPTYLQLVQQVEQALRLGLLGPGDQLPTVKEMVGSLAINPNTVMKAYRELEHRGLAAGRPGQGTFIKAKLQRVSGAEQAALSGGWRTGCTTLWRRAWMTRASRRCSLRLSAICASTRTESRRDRPGSQGTEQAVSGRVVR